MTAVTDPVAERLRFADRIEAARIAKHYSVRRLAREIEVPASTIQGWLNGRHEPAPSARQNYLRMLAILGLNDSADGFTPPESD